MRRDWKDLEIVTWSYSVWEEPNEILTQKQIVKRRKKERIGTNNWEGNEETEKRVKENIDKKGKGREEKEKERDVKTKRERKRGAIEVWDYREEEWSVMMKEGKRERERERERVMIINER